MFELPDAKRVRREDLDSSSEDEAPVRDDKQDAELLAKLHARMAGMLDLGSIEQQPAAAAVTPQKAKPAPKPKTGDGDDDDSQSEDDGAGDGDQEMQDKPDEPEEFEFRLFSSAPITKIALVDEDELALAKEGDMLRRRPMAYYVAEESAEAKRQFAEAAVDGEEVLERAKKRWWGMEQPWRVTTITNAVKAGGKDADHDEETARRRRPGKKKRIALRMREREKKKKAEEEEKAKMGKEEALKEKKKRLNRIKKLRKRAKEKAAKQGGGADGEDAGSGSGSDDGDE